MKRRLWELGTKSRSGTSENGIVWHVSAVPRPVPLWKTPSPRPPTRVSGVLNPILILAPIPHPAAPAQFGCGFQSGGSSRPSFQQPSYGQQQQPSYGQQPPAGGFQHQYTPRSQYMPDRAGVQQKSIYGQPYIEIDGSLGVNETDKVLARIETALRGRPRTIFLDLRRVDTVDASFLLAMEPTTYQLAANGGRLAVLTERQDVASLIHRLCPPAHTRVFPDLEQALWWLVDEGHA